jgi:hypothetical protein
MHRTRRRRAVQSTRSAPPPGGCSRSIGGGVAPGSVAAKGVRPARGRSGIGRTSRGRLSACVRRSPFVISTDPSSEDVVVRARRRSSAVCIRRCVELDSRQPTPRLQPATMGPGTTTRRQRLAQTKFSALTGGNRKGRKRSSCPRRRHRRPQAFEALDEESGICDPTGCQPGQVARASRARYGPISIAFRCLQAIPNEPNGTL